MRLVAEHVAVTLGGRSILSGVDLTAETGRSVAVVGPSGSGKTTLLAVLGGIVRPDAGRVRFDHDEGAVRSSDPQRAAEVTWIHQVPTALGPRSAIDNVALGALGAGLARPDAEDRAIDLLQALGLGARLHDPARRLSGGELQRVAIARALASDAPFVLADEPTGQLDRRTSDDVCAVLVETAVGTLGRSLVVVTHDARVAARCDETVHLHDGVLDR